MLRPAIRPGRRRWAIVSGHIKLSYDLQADLCLIMGEPGKTETGRYPDVIENYPGAWSSNTTNC